MSDHGGCPPSDVHDPHGLLRRIEALRSKITHREELDEAGTLLGDISDTVSTVMEEHGGMAEELLCVYEQLGIVFEVAANLSNAEQEEEIVALFVNSLQRTFRESKIETVRLGGDGLWRSKDQRLKVSEWLAALLQRTVDGGRVVVEVPPEGSMSAEVCQVMAGPLRSGDDYVCTVLLLRGAGEREFRASDMLIVESLTQFCSDLIRNQHLLVKLRETSIAMVRSLVSAVDQKDPYTSGHSVRVGYFAMLLGKEIGMDRDDLQLLQWSALLHDIGKIGIDDSVLKKQGKLTSEEREHIMEHPVRSFDVVKEVPQLEHVLDGVLHHHEHYDGNGYPDGLVGEEIPLQARVIQVADIFDALTSTRSYRKAFDWQKALSILEEEAGTTVDPSLQKTFESLITRLLSLEGMTWDKLIECAESFTRVDQLAHSTGPVETA